MIEDEKRKKAVEDAIGRGELSGQEAFMDGKYTVEGDMGLLVHLGQMFGD
jgi:putative sterol carrier protein